MTTENHFVEDPSITQLVNDGQKWGTQVVPTFTPEQVSRRLRLGMQFLKIAGEENNAPVKDKFLSLIEQSQEDFAKRGWEPYRRLLNQVTNGN